MSFFLVKLEPDGNGGMIDVPIPDFGPYDKGSEAAKFAKTLSETLGFKVQPRRISQAPDWRARQAKRLTDGALTPLPEKWDLSPIADHFAHRDPKDLSKIAFTENEELGIIDRVTSVTPGRYISRYYENIDDDHRRRLIASIDVNGEIFFARTREEIANVYIEGPESCMDGDHEFPGMDDIWPTEPYAGGDLAVAYTKNARGRIQSRALCWPEKKVFGRAYGDVQRMVEAMKAEGYTYLRADESWFPAGAKILKIEHPTKKHYFIMPYFDDIGGVVDQGDHFVTWDAETINIPGTKYISCGGSGGYSLLYRVCPRLRTGAPDHEFQFVHGVNEEWSRMAYESYAFTCNATKKRYPSEHRVQMATPGIVWSREHFEEHGAHCVVTKKNHPKDEMVQVGHRTVHQSVAHRFDDKGEELAIEKKKKRDSWSSDFTIGDYLDYERALHTIRPRDYHTVQWARDLIVDRNILDEIIAETIPNTNAA
jgi:hypothetical protein